MRMNDTARRRIRVAMVIAPVLLALFVAWNERTALFPFVLGVAIAYVIAPVVNVIAAIMPFAMRSRFARGSPS
jgi:predicted PurR-regulated permease PerM